MSGLISASTSIGVSLVDGDATIRHARQLMLRSERYEVRSYPTSAALLADSRSRDFACIVLDIERNDASNGVDVLRRMRASGWIGRAILLNDRTPDAEHARQTAKNGDRMVLRTIGDTALIAAIAAPVDHRSS